MKVTRYRGILLFIVILGFVLRIIGIGYGLPNFYHRDEQYYINMALGFGSGDFNPHIFENPPFASYLLFFLYGTYYVYLKLSGVVTIPSDFVELYLSDPSSFILIGRSFLGLLMGTISLPVIYLLGKKMFSKSVGLLAAFFLAVSALHVRDSHYACNNILLMLNILLFYLFLFQYIEMQRKKFFLGAAVFLGLAIGTKYNGALLFLPALLAFIPFDGRDWPMKIKQALIFFSLSFAVYFLSNPFSIIALREFIQSFSVQVADEYPVGPWHHLAYSLYEGVGLGILLLSVIGIWRFLKEDKHWSQIILLVGTALWYGVNIFFSQKYMRYTIPLLPCIYIFAALGLQTLFDYRSRLFKVTAVTLVLILFGLQTAKTLKADYLSCQSDNRDMARIWIEKNLPQEAVVAVPDWGPPLVQSEKQLRERMKKWEELQVINIRKEKEQINLYKNKKLLTLQKKAQVAPKTFYLYLLYGKPSPPLVSKPEIILYDWREIRKHRVEYLVLDWSFPEEFGPNFLEEVNSKTRLLKLVSPYRNNKNSGRYDPHENTAGSLENREVWYRLRYGDIIGIYRVNAY